MTLPNSTREISFYPGGSSVDEEAVRSAIQNRRALYDRNGDFHYDLISALHKSLRGGGGGVRMQSWGFISLSSLSHPFKLLGMIYLVYLLLCRHNLAFNQRSHIYIHIITYMDIYIYIHAYIHIIRFFRKDYCFRKGL